MVMKAAGVAALEKEIKRQAEPLQIAEVVRVPEVEVKMKVEAQPAGAIKLVKQAIPAAIARMKMKEAEEVVVTLTGVITKVPIAADQMKAMRNVGV